MANWGVVAASPVADAGSASTTDREIRADYTFVLTLSEMSWRLVERTLRRDGRDSVPLRFH